MEITSTEDLPLDVWQEKYITPIQNLISFASDKPNTLLELRFHSKFGSPPEQLGSFVFSTIEALFLTNTPPDEITSRLDRQEMVFTLVEVENNFSGILNSWLKIWQELDSVAELFSDMQYTPRMSLTKRFLSIAQALESYHRRKRNNYELNKGEHKKRIQRIMENVPEQDREWLQEKLNFSNEPTLRHRLIELVSEIEEVAGPLFGDLEATKNFIGKVVKSRNYYTHYTESLKKDAAKGPALRDITSDLYFILQYLFLRELGIEPSQCFKLLFKKIEYIDLALRYREDSMKVSSLSKDTEQ